MTANKIEVYGTLPSAAYASLDEAPDRPMIISSHAPTYGGLRSAIKSALGVGLRYNHTHGNLAARQIVIRYLGVSAPARWWQVLATEDGRGETPQGEITSHALSSYRALMEQGRQEEIEEQQRRQAKYEAESGEE